MNDFDIGWATAFFEAEGSLTLNRSPDGFTGMVQVSNLAREPLDKLASLFGGEVHRDRTGMYYWYRSSKIALPFLATVEPGITVPLRRKEIEMYKKFWSTTDHDERMHILMWWVGRIKRRQIARQQIASEGGV